MAQTTLVTFEWNDYGGTQQVKFLGKAPFGTGYQDPNWEIKFFTYDTQGDGNFHVTQIQTLDGKAWNDRATLPWA